MAKTFEEFMAAERERLTKEREEIFDQQKALEDKLDAVNRELAAITAYDDVKKGKTSAPAAPAAKRKGPAPGTPRAARGSGASAREKVLTLIREHPEGIASKDVQDQLSDIKNVANVLSSLNKEGLITQAARRQPWFPAAS